MPTFRFGIVLILLLAIPFSRPALAVEDEVSTATAAAAAGSFVTLLDAKVPGDAWQMFTPFAQISKPRDQWQELQQTLRTAYGPLEKRTLRGVTLQNRYTMLPDGRFAIVQFDTSFDKKQGAIETVVLARFEDGRWRVHDYVIY